MAQPEKDSCVQRCDTCKPLCDTCYRQRLPLTQYSYRKMMRSYYNFTILGTQTPNTGFSVETSKPTITLKGNIIRSKSRQFLVNLELTGGVDDNLMQVFSGGQLNGFFSATLGLNVMFPRGNSAKYVVNDPYLQMITRRKVCDYREELSLQIDSMLALRGLQEASGKNKGISLSDLAKSLRDSCRANGHYSVDGYYLRPFADTVQHFQKLIAGLIKRYLPEVDTSDQEKMYSTFMGLVGNSYDNTIDYSSLLADVDRLYEFRDPAHKYHLKDDFEVEAYKKIWTSKRICWLNISAAGSNSSFKLYDAGSNSITDGTSFLPSLSVTWNFFKKSAKNSRYFYYRFGVVFKRVNSLTDLDKFDYSKETVITVAPGETLKSTNTGTAYNGALSHGFGFEMPLELYWAPWSREAIPGIYFKPRFNHGEAWINKNKLAVDLGLVWNVVNNDKDAKNLLTIVPYVSWSNFLKEYKEIQKVNSKSLGDLFSVGLKFGIPVNLGN
jgi:hypothetical protein